MDILYAVAWIAFVFLVFVSLLAVVDGVVRIGVRLMRWLGL